MIDRRLHATVTLALAAGLVYLGSLRYLGGERVRAPNEQLRPDVAHQAEAMTPRRAAETATDRAVVFAPTLRQALGSVGSGEAALAATADSTGPAQARKILDERLREGAASPGEVARLERAVRPLLAPSLLGETVAELRCNATLCRIDLIAEDDARVASATNALFEHVPKVFSSTVAYPDGAGHRSLYLGTSADELKLDSGPHEVPEVVFRAESAPL